MQWRDQDEAVSYSSTQLMVVGWTLEFSMEADLAWRVWNTERPVGVSAYIVYLIHHYTSYGVTESNEESVSSHEFSSNRSQLVKSIDWKESKERRLQEGLYILKDSSVRSRLIRRDINNEGKRMTSKDNTVLSSWVRKQSVVWCAARRYIRPPKVLKKRGTF